MTAKAKISVGAILAIAAVFLLLCFRGALTDKKPAPARPSAFSRRRAPAVTQRSHLAPPSSETEAPLVIKRGKGLAIVASSEIVEQRPRDFSNTVDAVWECNLGTVFAAGDGAGEVNLPAGLHVDSLERALSRCSICLLLWDENIHQNVLQELQTYCRTGGWLLFISCPSTATAPQSSPAELLLLQEYQGVADARAMTLQTENPGAVATVNHPSLPTLTVGKRLWLHRPSYGALTGIQPSSITLVRFENPTLRGISIQSLGYGGIAELNWDCLAEGTIGYVQSREFLKKSLRWVAGKEDWEYPAEQPDVSLKLIAQTPEGDPAPGTRIALTTYTDWAKPISHEILTVGENGECEIRAKAPAIYSAESASQEYASDTIALVRAGQGSRPEPLVVTVRPVLAIVGYVVYSGDQPQRAPGLDVDLLPSSRAVGMEPRSCTTDEEGAFSFGHVPGGRSYLLRCETQEWGALTEIELPESTAIGTFDVALTLKKLVSIDGKVVEEGEDQTPIAGAVVRAEPSWGIKALDLFLEHLGKNVAYADAAGTFALMVFPELTYRVRAEAPEFVWPWPEQNERDYERWRDVQPPATVTFELRRGTTVKGIVYFPGGQPAPGAWAKLGIPHGLLDEGGRLQRTHPDGRFFFPCAQLQRNSVLRVKYVSVCAYSGRFSGYVSEGIPYEQTDVEVVVNMSESPLVQGIVTDYQERPLANAVIRSPLGTDLPPTAYSDENGFFESPIRGRLHVTKEGYSGHAIEYDTVKAAADANRLFRISLFHRKYGRIAGKVVLCDGTPLRNERVDIFTLVSGGSLRNAILGDNGEFEIRCSKFERSRAGDSDAQVETVNLRVLWCPDPKSRDMKIGADAKDIPLVADDVVVQFGPIFELSGRVVDGENGRPVSNASLTINHMSFARHAQTDIAGEFAFPWMTPGRCFVVATAPGYFPSGSRREQSISIQIDPESPDIGEIRLYRTLTVVGRAVYKASAIPVEGAEVTLFYAEVGRWPPQYAKRVELARAVTDSVGYFRMRIRDPFRDLRSEARDEVVSTLRMGALITKGEASGYTRLSLEDAPQSGLLELKSIELSMPEQR